MFNKFQAKDLTVGNSYYMLIDEAMGGYSAGVLKVKLLESSDEMQVINRYTGAKNGYEDLNLPVNTSHFQIEEIIQDWEYYYKGRETFTFTDINGENEEILCYTDATPEELNWIMESIEF